MFSDMDSDDFAKLAKIIGIFLFIVSFFLPAVANSYAKSPTDYLITSNAQPGWECAVLTLYGTARLFVPDPSDEAATLFFVVSGWITPLVIVFAIFPDRNKAKRIVAAALPFLLVAPLLFFASATKSGWGPDPFRPLIGHYVWTMGCLLIFTPQYARMLGARVKGR